MIKIPKEIKFVVEKLEKEGFEAFLVGGCVRDMFLGKNPKDWDITTSAKPKEIQKIFADSFYKNKFLTVTVKTKSKNDEFKEIEVTTYRKEAKYTDKRHPDKVEFAKTIEEDLSRRDFTVNAMALKPSAGRQALGLKLIDPFNGEKDLKNKVIRAVGKPENRLQEDALRLLRAVRFAAVLNFAPKDKEGIRDQNKNNETKKVFHVKQPQKEEFKAKEWENWEIEQKTLKAIKKNAHLIQAVSKERTRDEFEKIIMSENAYEGLMLMHNTGLLKYVIPELEKCYNVGQNRHHIYNVFEHSLLSLKYAAKYKYGLNVRLAALFHDIAKPQTKSGKGAYCTFYNHDVVGAKIAMRILSRLRFPKKTVEKVGLLVRYHMFFYDPETVTESSVRKLLRRVGPENIKELIEVRICDRKGSGVPKAKPYRLRHFEYMVSKVSRDPISVSMLKINGNDIINALKIKPGPKIGLILNALLSEVLEDPLKNKKIFLKKRVDQLEKLNEKKLKSLGETIKEKKTEIEQEEKSKFYIH